MLISFPCYAYTWKNLKQQLSWIVKSSKKRGMWNRPVKFFNSFFDLKLKEEFHSLWGSLANVFHENILFSYFFTLIIFCFIQADSDPVLHNIRKLVGKAWNSCARCEKFHLIFLSCSKNKWMFFLSCIFTLLPQMKKKKVNKGRFLYFALFHDWNNVIIAKRRVPLV